MQLSGLKSLKSSIPILLINIRGQSQEGIYNCFGFLCGMFPVDNIMGNNNALGL